MISELFRSTRRLSYTSNRQEDLVQRGKENTWKTIDNIRRQIDEKAQILKAIGEVSTLTSGFTLAALVEIKNVDDANTTLFIVYCTFAALGVVLLIIASFTTNTLLIAIYKFDSEASGKRAKANEREGEDFRAFWIQICDRDWNISFKSFSLGMLFFGMTMMLMPWVVFHKRSGWIIASSIVSAIMISTCVYLYVNTYSKWGEFLSKGSLKFVP